MATSSLQLLIPLLQALKVQTITTIHDSVHVRINKGPCKWKVFIEFQI